MANDLRFLEHVAVVLKLLFVSGITGGTNRLVRYRSCLQTARESSCGLSTQYHQKVFSLQCDDLADNWTLQSNHHLPQIFFRNCWRHDKLVHGRCHLLFKKIGVDYGYMSGW